MGDERTGVRRILRAASDDAPVPLCFDFLVNGEDDMGGCSSDCSALCNLVLEARALLVGKFLLRPLPGALSGLSSTTSVTAPPLPLGLVGRGTDGGKLSSSSG